MRSLQVLIADDFEQSRQSIKKMLLLLGVEKIDFASTGKHIIDACKLKKYDLILCDFNLGMGKNAQQVLEEIRANGSFPSTAMFIIISAETTRDVVMSLMEIKPDGFLTKPFTPSLLEKRVEHLIKRNDELKDIKAAEERGDHKRVIILCMELLKNKKHYNLWCKQKMANAFFAIEKLSKAQSICISVQKDRPIDWAMIIEAKIMKFNGFIDKAVAHLRRVIKLFPSCMQAYDLIVQYFEEKGAFSDAQKTLEQAVKLSPNVVARQQSLVDASLANGDLDTALKASQQTLKLSEHSIHLSSKQYLQAAEVISESILNDKTSDSIKKAKFAFNLLSEVSKKYPNNVSIILERRLVESRIFSCQGKLKEANEAFKQAQELIKEQPKTLTPKLSLEMGKSLYVLGKTEEAEKVFNKIVNENLGDRTLVAKIHAFIDEPVGRNARAEAKKYNALGLALYEEHKCEEAIEAFIKAQKASPKHPGLNMNLAQTIFRLMAENGQKSELTELCSDALDRLKNISRNHRQYTRYRNMCHYAAKNFHILQRELVAA